MSRHMVTTEPGAGVVMIESVLSRDDRGVSVNVKVFDGLGPGSVENWRTVERFYPWTSVIYIEDKS